MSQADVIAAVHRPLTARPRRQNAVLPAVEWLRSQAHVAVAAGVFLCWATAYGICLFPGLGGELNSGDSAKIQILGHSSIMLHGPGYPLVLMLGAAVRALDLPLAEWWTLTFALSALPGAIANMLAFLIVHRLTRSVAFGLAATLLLGSAGLMAVQATEAEVYALALAFILGTTFLLVLFVQTRHTGYFLGACAVYALSFGNHLLMIMLLPVFVVVTAAHWRTVLRPLPIAAVTAFILIGASQYLYLAHVAYDPATAYSEYMPLPPTPMELVHYIIGTYFRDLYGSGLASTRTLEALTGTLRSAHPWLSMPLIVAGLALFCLALRRGGPTSRGLAIVFGVALAFVPFVLWYGAYDIQAFHLPVLGPLLVASVATVGWFAVQNRRLFKVVAAALLVVGLVRAGGTLVLLSEREPIFAEVGSEIGRVLAQSPVEAPIIAMPYGLRMATLYYELRGDLPRAPIYRVHWRAIAEVRDQASVGGIVVPNDGFQFVSWIEHRRPDMRCTTERIELEEAARWPAYAFECRSSIDAHGAETVPVSAPAPAR